MTIAFTDPGVEPTPERIRAALGGAHEVWAALTRFVADAGLDLAWRYYPDGGWLARVTRAKATIAWVNVAPGRVRVTCYFAERHRAGLAAEPGLRPELRGRIAEVHLVGRLLPVTLELSDLEGLTEAEALLGAKLAAR